MTRLALNGHAYVLADCSGRYQPIEWAKIAITAYRTHGADRIVAEVNNGGEMVETTIRMVDPNVAFTPVRASRGKATRAEPVSALYEQARFHHLGVFPELEDQMCTFTPDLDRAAGSPDRVDALVWGASELLIAPMNGYAIYEIYREMAERLTGEPKIERIDPRSRREQLILAERQRYAELVAARMPGLPTPDEIAAHTAEIDRLLREGHRL